MRRFTFLLSLILLSSAALFAQTDAEEVSDTELTNFAEVFQEVQQISEGKQDKMVQAIEGEGLTLERYNAIGKAQRSGDEDFEITEEEIEKLQVINSKLVEIDSKTNEAIQTKLSANDLTYERYRQIFQSVQKSDDLKIKLRDKLQEKMQREAQEETEEETEE